jgi:hypothetical protein
MVSEDNAKYFRDFKHIRQFFMDVKNNKLTMSEQLVQWNTARLMRRDLEKLRFLKCFHKFNPELTQWFHEAEALTRTYDTDKYIGRFGNREEFVKDLGNYLDRVGEFQDFVRKNQSDFEAITAMAKGMLNPADGIELTDARAVDFDRYDQFLEILDMVSPVYVMLNDMTSLKGGPMAISAEVEQEIRNYIVSKGAQSLLTYKPDHDDHSESR